MKSLIAVCLTSLAFSLPLYSQIKPGRAIELSIKGVPPEERARIDGTYPVSDGGMINVPYVGLVRAAGMQPDSLQSLLENLFKSRQIYRNPTIQVISTDVGGQVTQQIVHLGGQVKSPGQVPFRPGLTLYQAIQQGGGPTPYGSMKRVTLLRDGKQRIYNVDKSENMQIQLQEGDTITVPQKNLWGG